MPIAHVSLPVSSLSAATAFYLSALKPLGYDVFMKLEHTVGLSIKYDGPDFWLHQCPDPKQEKGLERTGMHVAFKAGSRKAVEEFHAAALCVSLSISQQTPLPRLVFPLLGSGVAVAGMTTDK